MKTNNDFYDDFYDGRFAVKVIPNISMSDINTIKVIVISQTKKLNGRTYTITCVPVGTILDAIPNYYGKNNSIMNYTIIYTLEQMRLYHPVSEYGLLPTEIVKPLAKHREDIINSILDD